MRDARAEEGKAGDAGEQVEEQQDRDDELCRDRDRHKHDGQLRIGMEKPKGHQETVDGARGAEHRSRVDPIEIGEHRLHFRIRRHLPAARSQQRADGGRLQPGRDQLAVEVGELVPVDRQLNQTRANATDKIEEQEPLRAPLPLQDRPKRDQREHVEQNMAESPMQKHVRHQLPHAKMNVGRIPQRADLNHALVPVRQQEARGKHHDVHDQEAGDGPGHAIHRAKFAILPWFATWNLTCGVWAEMLGRAYAIEVTVHSETERTERWSPLSTAATDVGVETDAHQLHDRGFATKKPSA